MYRILIADDEPLEREGMEFIIKTMLKREVEIILAENGRDAIEKAQNTKPHIILMDIRMPGIDGLTALKTIKEGQPQCKMVLVTAYEYFDYAKTAIQIGVKDYLVKPAKRQDIVELLDRLLFEIDKESQQKHLNEQHLKRLDQFVQLTKTELALGLMSEQMTEEALASLAHLVEFKLHACCALVIAFPFSCKQPKQMEQFIISSMEELIAKQNNMQYSFIASTILNDHLALFISAHHFNSTTVLNDMKGLASLLLQKLTVQYDHKAYVGIGSLQHDISGIKRSYFEAIFASTNVDDDAPICLFEQIKQLLNQPLQARNLNDAVYVQKAIEKIRQERDHETFTMIDSVTAYIQKNYNKELTLEEAADYVHLNPYYFSKIFKQQTGETFIDYLTQIRIGHAKKWMEQKDLSLKEICYLVGYNDPNYLSRVFKKVVGLTPSEYRQSIN